MKKCIICDDNQHDDDDSYKDVNYSMMELILSSLHAWETFLTYIVKKVCWLLLNSLLFFYGYQIKTNTSTKEY